MRPFLLSFFLLLAPSPRTARAFLSPPSRRSIPRPPRATVSDRYDLSHRFERWTFLQKLLENELPPNDVEDVLCEVLEGYLHHGPEEGDVSPAWDDERREAIRRWLEEVSSLESTTTTTSEEDCARTRTSRFLHHFVRPPVDYEREWLRSSRLADEDVMRDDVPIRARRLLAGMEELLPHPTDEEEAHKSAWDLVVELYGRESVRVKEEKLRRLGEEVAENREWKTLCCLGRVLIHYDFLSRGILLRGDGRTEGENRLDR